MTDKQIDALKLAREALEYISSHYMSLPKIGCMALAAVEEALAEQPAQQEPVAWRNAALRVGEDLCSVGPFGYYDMTAEQWLDWALSVVTVHAPPASKPWVGLTQQEQASVLASVPTVPFEGDWHLALFTAIEAKLREKNHG